MSRSCWPRCWRALAPRDGGRYLDGTFGGGGYAGAILDAAALHALGDRPRPGCDRPRRRAGRRAAGRLHLLEGRFGDMLALLEAEGIGRLDGVVLDLGVSSFQLDENDARLLLPGRWTA